MPRYRDEQIPVGSYLFKIIREPEFHKYGKMIAVKFVLRAVAPDGTVYENVHQSLPRWECGDIWRAIGFEKDPDGYWDIDESECIGKEFEAKIKYEKDRKDPRKSWYRVRDVVIPIYGEEAPPSQGNEPSFDEYENEPPPPDEEDEEVPF